MTLSEYERLPVPSLHDLYPGLNEDELKALEEEIDLCLEECLQNLEEIMADPERYARFRALTQQMRTSRIGDKDLNS